MWKTLVDRFDSIFDQAVPFGPPQRKPTFFKRLFQRSAELGDGFSLQYRIKSLIDRIKTGTKQVQVDQQDLMTKLRASVPTIDNVAHIKNASIAKHQPSSYPAPSSLPRPLERFEPGNLGMDIDDLTFAVTKVIIDTTERLMVTRHLAAADRIHTSVCASYPLPSVDRNLNLGESNTPSAILATINRINKDKLSEEEQQSIEVLKKSVVFYNAKLQP